jgi:hypothetical protein
MTGFITSPPPERFPPVVPVANDYVALPDISADGAIGSVQVLSDQAQGLVGIVGRPLLHPVLGDEPLGPAAQERLDHWIPVFRWTVGDLVLTETILTPVEAKGFVVVLELENKGRAIRTRLGLEGVWEQTTYTLFRERPLPVTMRLRADPWTGSLAMEALAGLPVVAWAIHPVPDLEMTPPVSGDGPGPLRLVRDVGLGTGERTIQCFYIGLGREEDGARTTAVDLRRRGWERLLAGTRAWFRPRLVGGGSRLAALYNINLLFNRFFACGRTIDTENWVWVTSRSPRYYVSAAFWSRDAFLWSLPGLLLADREAARAMLEYAFRTQWRNAGMHAQYLNGAVIYPGFELDELAAFPVGLGSYLRATGDATILQDAAVADAMRDYPSRLARWRGSCGLHETFLDPSDDPVRYPYLTYDNVLAWRGLLDAAEVLDLLRVGQEAALAREAAARLMQAIRTHCVVDGPSGPMFAWAVDGHGAFELYDDPPGSLLLLPYHGFCDPAEPTYVNTAAWVWSPANPWYVDGPFGAPACLHSPDPWPMAVVNDLLVGNAGGLKWLRRAPMDGGVACETVDRESGAVKTGGAFATFAGLLAAALARHRAAWED